MAPPLYVSLRYNDGVPTVPPGRKKRSDPVVLLTSHEDEAAAAHSNNSKGTKLATIVPCSPLHPLGAFMHDGKVTTDSVNIEDADYTHRVLSRWVIDDDNHNQVLELAGNVGVKPGKDQRTHQRVNYANMVASDQRTSRPVNGARVYADAWVFPVATLTSTRGGVSIRASLLPGSTGRPRNEPELQGVGRVGDIYGDVRVRPTRHRRGRPRVAARGPRGGRAYYAERRKATGRVVGPRARLALRESDRVRRPVEPFERPVERPVVERPVVERPVERPVESTVVERPVESTVVERPVV